MSVGPIPWSAIDAYARRYRIDDEDQFGFLVQMIRAMDAVFLASISDTPQPQAE